MGMLLYGAELWGSAPKHIKKFQTIQLEAARTVLGPRAHWRSMKKLLWMYIQQLLEYASNNLTYKILHLQKRELPRYRMNDANICFTLLNPECPA